MSGPGVGFEYPAKEVTWLKRDALLFAASIGCTHEELHFLYELDPDFAVFPTYPIILPFKTDTQEVIDFYAAQKAVKIPGVPDFDSQRVVDGQRLVQFLKPLPTSSVGKKFEIRTKVVGVYDKGRPGSVVETQTDLVDAGTGEVYSRAIGSAFFVAQGNWGGPKGPATENFPPPKGKQPDVTFEDQTTQQTALLYRLNGDYNPLHAHPEPGKKMGFGGAIIHGLYSFNSTAHGLLKSLGASDPKNIKEFQARFASPVKPGDKLVTQVWKTGEIKDGWEEIRDDQSTLSYSEMPLEVKVGDRLSYDGAICTVRYLGHVADTSGRSTSPTAASFVRPTRSREPPRSFIAALQDKYTGEVSAASAQIKFSGKVAEEVGFQKIQRKQANLAELKFVLLDGTRIACPYAEGDQRIGETCPKAFELDLSRNLFTSLETVVHICSELPGVRNLRLNGNRFQDVSQDEGLEDSHQVFQNVKELALEETLMSWEELCHVSSKFQSLTTLSADSNQLGSLPQVPSSTLSSTLLSLNLEFNDFTSLSDIASLAELKALRNLHLKGNQIGTVTNDTSEEPPVFSPSLQYLDISYNEVSTWSFIDDLPVSLPGLTHLRFTHNPIYDNPDPEHSAQSKTSTEEAYMITVGRLANLKVLNFGTISANDRQDAEMFYLARIGKHLATVPQDEEAHIVKGHKRFSELVELYGPPVINRQKEINPAFLEARLVTVQFVFLPKDGGKATERISKIPKSFDIYRTKGIAAKQFGIEPLSLRLIWETGEWDPVAGFDDEVEDSSDEEDAGELGHIEVVPQSDSGRKAGRWVKREVELQDGPRQLGFCVDGSDAKIRVEVR
ncbi:putative HotDog domain-containing protein [Seiridium cardinale]|uniref:HotDog domain-containing protein n=1 Tax=Seiridium cardinale TaxID=138064 RepID=A0ABR2XIN2_9PEZI